MQGRLQGKRLVADHFLDDVVEHGAEGCNYLLAVDVDMNTVDGYAMSSWETRLRRLRAQAGPRHAAAGAVARGAPRCAWPTSPGTTTPTSSPRRARSCAASSTGWPSAAGRRWPRPSSSSSSSATPTRRRGARPTATSSPANHYNVDYSMLGTSRVEPLIGRIRREMARRGPAGRELQGRVQLRPARDQLHLRGRARRRRHAHDLQERRQGDRQPGGHGDHVHGQVRRARGQLVPHPPLAARARTAASCSATSRSCSSRFVAGQLACLRELTLFLAPNVNSYKRYAEGSFAPTAVAWGRDNRTCSLRVVGHGPVAAGREPRARAATSTRTSRSPR